MKSPSNVENTMSKSILSVRWNHPMSDAWKLMEERRVRHLPVVGDDGCLVGILSDRDVKRAMDPKFPSFRKDCIVGEFMNWPVLTAERSASLVSVLDTLIAQKVSALVITEGKAMVGILTTEDFLKLLRGILKGEQTSAFTLFDLPYEPYIQEAIREAASVGI